MSLPTTAASSVQSLPDVLAKSSATLVARDLKAAPLHASQDEGPRGTKRELRFWLVFMAICVSLFLSALESVSRVRLRLLENLLIALTVVQTAVSTALPTIVYDLQGVDFVWVSSAYCLASTALLPMSGGMAQV